MDFERAEVTTVLQRRAIFRNGNQTERERESEKKAPDTESQVAAAKVSDTARGAHNTTIPGTRHIKDSNYCRRVSKPRQRLGANCLFVAWQLKDRQRQLRFPLERSAANNFMQKRPLFISLSHLAREMRAISRARSSLSCGGSDR